MSSPDESTGPPKYYDPGEVEAYVRDATSTIKALQARLQEVQRRADEAEQAFGGIHPETAGLGRALLLASEVADKTIADADTRAAEIVKSAQEQAAGIIAAAHAEADHLVEGARQAAANVFQNGETRLLAAVSAFIEGSNVLRSELAKVEDDATSWRNSGRSSPPRPPPEATPPTPPPIFAPEPPVSQVPGTRPVESRKSVPWVQPDRPGGVHNRAGRDGHHPSDVDQERPEAPETSESPFTVTPFSPPKSPYTGSNDRHSGDRT